jgi:PIN domain nuclease of toxin-antitoxin system
VIVLDTHVLVWLIEGNKRLGKKAKAAMDEATPAPGLFIPAISFWEIAMLVGKGRLALGQDIDQWIRRVLALPGVNLAPLEPVISIESVRLPGGGYHGDPADRLIIATARHHGATLMTVDSAILAYASAGHVRAMDAGA